MRVARANYVWRAPAGRHERQSQGYVSDGDLRVHVVAMRYGCAPNAPQSRGVLRLHEHETRPEARE